MRYSVLVLVIAGFAHPNVQAQPTADSLDALFSTSKKSVPLAFGMSAIVPGAGQVYNRNWIKAAVAIAGEAAVLLLYRSWHQKGNDGRDAYQMEAHAHWSPVRYASWLNDYMQYLNHLPGGRPVTANPIEISSLLSSIDLTNPDAWSQSDQLAVRSLIQEIRRVEGAVYNSSTGAAFSHVLPFFGEQQYYELIGKYFQYAPGWDDYVALTRNGQATWITEDGEFVPSIEPETSGSADRKAHVSPRFYQYADNHADANTYLRRASRITTLLIANHILAAVDAAVFARLHNRRMQVSLGLLGDMQGRTYVAPRLHFILNQ